MRLDKVQTPVAVHCSAAGYMACICYGFFIMLGTVGWRASLMFVRHIYKVILRYVIALMVVYARTHGPAGSHSPVARHVAPKTY